MTFEPERPRVVKHGGFRAELRRVVLDRGGLQREHAGLTRVWVDVHVPPDFEVAELHLNEESAEPCQGRTAQVWVFREQLDRRTGGTHQQLLGQIDQIPSAFHPSSIDLWVTTVESRGLPRSTRCVRLPLASRAPYAKTRRLDASRLFLLSGVWLENTYSPSPVDVSMAVPFGLGTGVGTTLISASAGLAATNCVKRVCGVRQLENGEQSTYSAPMLPLDLEADFVAARTGFLRLKLGVRAGGRLVWLERAPRPKRRFMFAPALVGKLAVTDHLPPGFSAGGPEPGTSLQLPVGILHDPVAPSSTSFFIGFGLGFTIPVD